MPGDPLAMGRLSSNLDPFPAFSSSAWSGKELSMTLRGAERIVNWELLIRFGAHAAPGLAAASAGAGRWGARG